MIKHWYYGFILKIYLFRIGYIELYWELDHKTAYGVVLAHFQTEIYKVS